MNKLTRLPSLLYCTLIAARVELLLKFRPLDIAAKRLGVVISWQSNSSGSVSPQASGNDFARNHLANVDSIMRRWPFGDTCLRRSLILGKLLADFNPKLLIGVGTQDSTILAHAWIESDLGNFYIDESDTQSMVVLKVQSAQSESASPESAKINTQYLMHGLLIESPISLDATHVPNGNRCDVTISLQRQREIPQLADDGKLLSFVDSDPRSIHRGRRLLSVTENSDCFVMRYHKLCDVRISKQLTEVEITPDPLSSPDTLATVVGTGVSGFLVTMRGIGNGDSTALHASAVAYGDKVVGFVGSSGSYKSTSAALACSLGASFVTDDTLRLAIDGNNVIAYAGTCSVRLRPGSSFLIEKFPKAKVSYSDDERTIVELRDPSPTSTPTLALPLSAIIFMDPFMSDQNESGERNDPDYVATDSPPQLEESLGGIETIIQLPKLSATDTLLNLMSNSRIDLSLASQYNSKQFEICSNLSRLISAYTISTPLPEGA